MMRLLRWLLFLGILAGGGYYAVGPVRAYWKERNRINFREDVVSKGSIIATVNSTGTIKPTRTVQIGSFVSGPIESISVDFNADVKKGDLLAKIDPRLYAATVARDRALLATRRADVDRVKAQLQQARNNETRAIRLKSENKDFISDAEMDQFKFTRQALEADLTVAETSIETARANLETSEANLSYTEIRAPVDGVVIDRKIDPGQTVAASFQTPELFTIAPDMRQEMRVFASVDEADIGLITAAQKSGLIVKFTVDAYQDDLFTGTIFQIRKSSTTTQNVVTYPVVVSAPNPDLKLMPGMTASLSFQVGEVKNVLRVPNASLRFYPLREQVREEDRKLLEVGFGSGSEEDDRLDSQRSAMEKAENRKKRSKRHVWVRDGDLLRAVPVISGLSDGKFTEIIGGGLEEGTKVVTGVMPKS